MLLPFLLNNSFKVKLNSNYLFKFEIIDNCQNVRCMNARGWKRDARKQNALSGKTGIHLNIFNSGCRKSNKLHKFPQIISAFPQINKALTSCDK